MLALGGTRGERKVDRLGGSKAQIEELPVDVEGVSGATGKRKVGNEESQKSQRSYLSW
jgi:hypothetical protein